MKSIEEMTETERSIALMAAFAQASGTSEGATKGWESRKGGIGGDALSAKMTEHDTAMHAAKTPEQFEAHKASREAYELTEKSTDGSDRATHNQAGIAHDKARFMQERAGNTAAAEMHKGHAEAHHEASAENFRKAEAERSAERKSNPTGSTVGWRQKNRDASFNNRSDD